MGNEEELPVDQHMLLACIAPRRIYVAAAEDDLWSDPVGAWNSLLYSRDAFKLYGLETIEGEVITDGSEMTDTDIRLFSESMGWHIRSGWHDMTEADWANYLDYMDQYF